METDHTSSSGEQPGPDFNPHIPLESFSDNQCGPRAVGWNSLEGRPRREDVSRALRAEIRDPLWMISRQWQMGEFDGEDGGSLIFSRLSLNKTHLNRYAQGAGDAFAYDGAMPLETQVEREAVPIDSGMRMEMGRHWLGLMNHFLVQHGISAGKYDTGYVSKYPIAVPAYPTGSGQSFKAALVAYGQAFTSADAWRARVAGEQRVVDGFLVYQAVQSGAHLSDGVVNMGDPQHAQALQDAGAAFLAWFERNYAQPGLAGSAWSSSHLEYQFSCAAPQPDNPGSLDWLVADEYANGHLDWFSFDLAPSGFQAPADAPNQSFSDQISEDVLTLLPSKLFFDGMPNARWWEFEDRRVDWGGLDLTTTDVPKLLMLDFMLNYSNDWYLIPYASEVGSLISVAGIELQDVFGVRTLVKHANEGNPANWRRWNMFSLSPRGGQTSSETRLFLAPAAVQVQEGKPMESVMFLRDDMANMAWGVEKVVPDDFFGGRDGQEAAQELFGFLQKHAPAYTPPATVPTDAPLHYSLATRVPENWIPLLPNHVSSANRGIRLQRSAMPRDIPGLSVPVVEPRSVLLRTGLDVVPAERLFVNEEEVPDAGAIVERSWQRTRWHDGRVCVWVGRRKRTGRGGGASGLMFDQVKD